MVAVHATIPSGGMVGTVVGAGDGAADWQGRPVLVPAVLPCGDCVFCRRGRVRHCATRIVRAGVAAHETLPTRFLCALDGPLAFADDARWPLALLGGDGALAYAAVCRAGVAPGAVALVVGGGLLGALTIALLRAVGAEAILLDDDEPARARARELGALRALTLTEGAALGPVGLMTALGDDHAHQGDPIEPLFVTSADTQAATLALELAPPGATVLFVGTAARTVELDSARELTLGTVAGCHPDLLFELVALVKRGALPLHQLVRAQDVSSAAAPLDEETTDCATILRFA